MADVTVHAICGSLREGSHTRTTLECALDAAAAAGGETELIELGEYDLPIFDADVDRADAGDAAELARRVRTADAIILGSPMYHGSYSSPLKTALDYCGFDEFEDKTGGLVGVAGGAFPVTALEHLRTVCRALNAWVLPHQVAVPNANGAIEDGSFVDDRLEARVRTLGERVVQYAAIEPDPGSFEADQNRGG